MSIGKRAITVLERYNQVIGRNDIYNPLYVVAHKDEEIKKMDSSTLRILTEVLKDNTEKVDLYEYQKGVLVAGKLGSMHITQYKRRVRCMQ